MSKDIESFFVRVSSMSLHAQVRLLIKRRPIVSIYYASFHEEAIFRSREVLSSNDLSYKMNFWNVVGLHVLLVGIMTKGIVSIVELSLLVLLMSSVAY